MSGLIEMCRRARDRAGAPVRGVTTIAAYLFIPPKASLSYRCDRCFRTFRRLTAAQATQLGSDLLPDCRRWRCRGLLWPSQTPAEQTLQALLRKAGQTILLPDGGLERSRKRVGGAPLHGDAATSNDDQLGSETPMSIIPKPAKAIRPGDTITRHPDYGTRVRLRVIRGARPAGDGVLVDYTAPPDEIPGMTPNDRASGVLFLAPGQPCEVEPAPHQIEAATRNERTLP